MKLLLDANLSYRLVKKLTSEVFDCLHVTRTGLPIPAEDIAIWQWAKTNIGSLSQMMTIITIWQTPMDFHLKLSYYEWAISPLQLLKKR